MVDNGKNSNRNYLNRVSKIKRKSEIADVMAKSEERKENIIDPTDNSVVHSVESLINMAKDGWMFLQS